MEEYENELSKKLENVKLEWSKNCEEERANLEKELAKSQEVQVIKLHQVEVSINEGEESDIIQKTKEFADNQLATEIITIKHEYNLLARDLERKNEATLNQQLDGLKNRELVKIEETKDVSSIF